MNKNEVRNIEIITGKKAVLHRSIHKLPLARFIDCAVDNNLRALIIEGIPEEVELIEAWNEISQDYTDALGSVDQDRRIKLYKEITRLQLKVATVEQFIPILKNTYVKKFADYVNAALFTKFSFDIKNPEQYDKELEKCLKRVKGIRIDIKSEEAILKSIEERKKGSQEPKYTREYFGSILINLSDQAGFDIDEEKISTYKFCERVKRYIDYIEKLKKR
jgi:hypothetical protein